MEETTIVEAPATDAIRKRAARSRPNWGIHLRSTIRRVQEASPLVGGGRHPGRSRHRDGAEGTEAPDRGRLNATRAAVEEGIVAGRRGSINAIGIRRHRQLEGDEKTGATIVKKSFRRST